jgi:hypothetical protein
MRNFQLTVDQWRDGQTDFFLIDWPSHICQLTYECVYVAFFLIYRRSGGHFLNPILNFLNLICLKFGETLPLADTKRMDKWELCPKFEEPIGALPQIWGKWQNDVPVRLFSSFLQKSQSSCHCFDRHQLGFTNSILLNGIFDICSRIYSLQIGHQCYLQSAPSVGINLNHDLEEGSYWSINFVLTNKSVSPNLRVDSGLSSRTDLGNVLLRP